MRSLAVVLLLVAGALAQKDQTLFQTRPESKDDVLFLRQEIEPNYMVDFWSHPAVDEVTFFSVHKSDADKVEALLGARTTGNTMKIMDDISHMFDAQYERLQQNVEFKEGDDPRSITLNEYHSHSEINAFLDSTASSFSSIASTFSIGSSHQGRDMKGIKIGTSGSGKKAVLVDAGIHAREWIAPAMNVYFIHYLTNNYGSDTRVTQLLNDINVYVLPQINPDGYEYSRSSSSTRLWRKNRSGPVSGCYGADLNRNYPFHHGGEGTSSNPCSDIYHGGSGQSEVETRNMVNFLRSRTSELKGYLTTHCYGQYWLVPYGYTSGARPDDYNELLTVGNRAATALRNVHGTRYSVGNTADLLYSAAGGSDDYAKSIGIKYSYTPELRPSPSSFNGFVLAERHIIPTGEETTAAYLEVMEAARDAP